MCKACKDFADKVAIAEKTACKECPLEKCIKKNNSENRHLSCVLRSVNWEPSEMGKLEKRLGLC